MSKQLPDTETCARPDCEQPTPWDMLAVVLDGTWCCSPACALDHLDGLKRPPETVTLHDPQYHVDRDALLDVSSGAVDIRRDVVGMAEAIEAIRDADELFPGQFRAGVGPRRHGGRAMSTVEVHDVTESEAHGSFPEVVSR